ncbi:hypothetical protein ACFS6H_09045 [Terrimonas rubra]|uniref:Uncharacterized protein n=1 Tax=Terrimonas rubra TaxID=1035890 RepID=A0ABW6A5X1_9BACT
MRKFHPFFTIGTVGMMLTAILHIMLSFSFSLTATNKIFGLIYPTFMAFLIIGIGLTVKKQKEMLAG